ncbi:uncharacterized protein LOC108026585 [Drosophila biarmipes]|uniref:uncharacterized protein LOC108026585 n=1 Tax=Drosophila biarmipes TaxID=125945 RepID=UPI001CDA9080|nr:uncharacterized protein LOC108026585 [Drosophila biarmipes]
MSGQAVKAFIAIKRLFFTFVTIFLMNLNGADCTSGGGTNAFPSVAICLTKGRSLDEVRHAAQRRFPGEKLPGSFIRVLKDYLFVNPNDLYSGGFQYCQGRNSTCGVDILDLRRELLPRNCKAIFDKISFGEQTIPDCEEIFKFHELELGNCFLANNYMDYDSTEKMPLQYSSLDEHRSLKLDFKRPKLYNYELHVLSNEDVPNFASSGHPVTSQHTKQIFEVEESPERKSISEPVSQRKCRLPSEHTIEGIPYSHSSCVGNRFSELGMDKCNCSVFSYQDQSSRNFCGTQGLICLYEEMKVEVGEHIAADRTCLPSCVHQNVKHIGDEEYDLFGFVVEIKLESRN